MYESHWGLKEKPFENTPDPRFIYYSQQHKEAIARMLYVVREHKGAGLLTGEYGSGKTLISRVLWQELQQDKKYQSAFILNPRLSGVGMLQEIVRQLSTAKPPSNKLDLFHALQEIIYSNHKTERYSVIVIDEAQAIISKDVFEELRLLLNFQLEQAFLLTIVFFGQPELKSKILNLPQLEQRMSVRYHLSALDQAETKEYILHRLEVAGSKDPIFSDEAYEAVYFFSTGLPRRINNICDMALLVGFGNALKMIDRKTIEEVSQELEITPPAAENNISHATASADKR